MCYHSKNKEDEERETVAGSVTIKEIPLKPIGNLCSTVSLNSGKSPLKPERLIWSLGQTRD